MMHSSPFSFERTLAVGLDAVAGGAIFWGGAGLGGTAPASGLAVRVPVAGAGGWPGLAGAALAPAANAGGAVAAEDERLVGGVEHAASTARPIARQKLKRNIMRFFPGEQGVCLAAFVVLSRFAAGNIPRRFAQRANDTPPVAGLKKVDLIKQRRYGLSRPRVRKGRDFHGPTGGISGENRAG